MAPVRGGPSWQQNAAAAGGGGGVRGDEAGDDDVLSCGLIVAESGYTSIQPIQPIVTAYTPATNALSGDTARRRGGCALRTNGRDSRPLEMGAAGL